MDVFGKFFVQILTLAFMLVGLLGLVIPIFPGIAVIWLAAAGYALYSLFSATMTGWDWFLFALITGLGVFGGVVDNLIIAAKLRETGTPWRSILMGIGAGLVSSLFLTPLAALFVTPLALYAAEYARLRDKHGAFQSTRAFLIGFGWTFVALFAIGAVMIFLWALWAFV